MTNDERRMAAMLLLRPSPLVLGRLLERSDAMNTRHRCLFTLIAAVALLLAACGGTPPAAEQPSSAASQAAAPTSAPESAAEPTAAPAAEPTSAAPEPTAIAEPAQSGGGQKIRVWIVDWGETTGQFTKLLT